MAHDLVRLGAALAEDGNLLGCLDGPCRHHHAESVREALPGARGDLQRHSHVVEQNELIAEAFLLQPLRDARNDVRGAWAFDVTHDLGEFSREICRQGQVRVFRSGSRAEVQQVEHAQLLIENRSALARRDDQRNQGGLRQKQADGQGGVGRDEDRRNRLRQLPSIHHGFESRAVSHVV